MKDTVLFRCDKELLGLVDWFSDYLKCSRSQVIRLVLESELAVKKKSIEDKMNSKTASAWTMGYESLAGL